MVDIHIRTTCNLTLMRLGEEAVLVEAPLWGNWTFHKLGLWIAAGFAGVAVGVALILIFLHATHYSKPYEQRHIIRILLMIPIYASISFLSYKFYKHAIYWEVIRDCYEAFAIASFFHLLCHYVEPTLHEQKKFFRTLTPRNWVMPVNWVQSCTGGKEKGLFRIPRSGLTWFNIVWVGVFQYCLVRVLATFAALITQLLDKYCESSLSPAFAHIWILTVNALAVTIAMYCLIQFYVQLKGDLKSYKPFLKVCAIKLVIFFSFWQNLLISFLSSGNDPVIKTGPRVSYVDVKIGIPSVLLCIEMALFAILHIFAFPWKPYDISKSDSPNAYYFGGFLGWKAILDAFNPIDTVKASARGFRWLFVGMRNRHKDESYDRHAPPVTLSSGAKISAPYPLSPEMESEEYKGAGAIYENDGSNIELMHPGKRTQTADDFTDHTALLPNSQGIPISNAPSEVTPLYPTAGPDRSANVTPQPGPAGPHGYHYVAPVSPGLPPMGYAQEFGRAYTPPSQMMERDNRAPPPQHQRQGPRRDGERDVGVATTSPPRGYRAYKQPEDQSRRRDDGGHPPQGGGGGGGASSGGGVVFGQAF